MVGVDTEQYDPSDPSKYLRGFLDNKPDVDAQKAFGSYLGILPSSPIGFENFSMLVNEYMERSPFNYPNPLNRFGGSKMVGRYELSSNHQF